MDNTTSNSPAAVPKSAKAVPSDGSPPPTASQQPVQPTHPAGTDASAGDDSNEEEDWGSDEGEEEEECDDDSLATSEDAEEDEEALGGERSLEVSSDDEDDEELAALLRNARGLLTYVGATYIPRLRRMYENRCAELFPQIEASVAAKYENSMASLRKVAASAAPGGQARLSNPEEMGIRPPLSIRPNTSSAASAVDKKKKEKKKKESAEPPRQTPYSREDLYAPLPTDEQERLRFQFAATALIPPWVKVEGTGDGSEIHFIAPEKILKAILGNKKEAAPTPPPDTDIASTANTAVAPASPDSSSPLAPAGVPNLLNMPTVHPTTAIVEYGCHRGERPVLFDPSNTWPHYEGGWTRDRLSASKNLFLNAKFEANEAKAALLAGLVRRRITEEEEAAAAAEEGAANNCNDNNNDDNAGNSTATAPSATTTTANERAALSALAAADPYYHLKLPPFGSRAHRYVYEEPLMDICMAVPLRKYDPIIAYAALARMGPQSDDVSAFYRSQLDARRESKRAAAAAKKAKKKNSNNNSTSNGNDDNNNSITNNNNATDDADAADDDDDDDNDDDDDPTGGIAEDARMVVFALDALVTEEEGGDLANRNRPWLAEKGGFGLINEEYPTIAIFLLAASVLSWRLTALGGERHAELCDAMILFYNLMRAAVQYVDEEETLTKKLQKSYAKKINTKNGPKARQVRPEAVTPDFFTAADAAPLLPYRNAFVQLIERTRKTFMLELAWASRLPNEVFAGEEQRRMGALRGWAAAEEAAAGKPEGSSIEGGRKAGRKWARGGGGSCGTNVSSVTNDTDPASSQQQQQQQESSSSSSSVSAASAATLYSAAQRLNITGEVLWGLQAQRMGQTDAAAREPYLNLEVAQLEVATEGLYNYFGERVGVVGEEQQQQQQKSFVQLLPFETRQNLRRWGTPFGEGGRCHSDLFEGLEGVVDALAVVGDNDANRPKAIVSVAGDSSAAALPRFVLGPFPADCTFAPPYRHTPAARPARTLGGYLCALNTEDEPHYWAAFGDYLAAPDAMATTGAVPTAPPTALLAASSASPLLSFPIPHPMQIFDVRLTNPTVSFDCFGSCDLCGRRNLRMAYEARGGRGGNKTIPISVASVMAAAAATEDAACAPASSLSHLRTIATLLPKPTSSSSDAAPPSSQQPQCLGGREHFQFTGDHQQSGFDVCVTCAAALASEAHIAILSAVGAVAVAGTEKGTAEKAADSAAAVAVAASGADAMAPPSPESLVSTDASLGDLVAQSAERDGHVFQRKMSGGEKGESVVVTRRVTVAAVGARPTIGINNRMRIGATAKVRINTSSSSNDATGGVLTLYMAVSPIGARPVARVWAEGYGSLLRDQVLEKAASSSTTTTTAAALLQATSPSSSTVSDFSSYSYTNHPAYTAASRLIAAAAALRPFLVNASRVPTRQLCNIRCSTSTSSADGGGSGTYTYAYTSTAAADAEDDADGHEEDECPICLEPLSFAVGGGAQPFSSASLLASDGTVDFPPLASFSSSSSATAATAAASHGTGHGLHRAHSAQLTRRTSSCHSRGGGDAADGGVSGGIAAAKQTSCGHWFHPQCLEAYMTKQRTGACPVCRCPNALESLAVRQMRAVERARKRRQAERRRRLADEMRAVNANNTNVDVGGIGSGSAGDNAASGLNADAPVVETADKDEDDEDETFEDVGDEDDEENEEGEWEEVEEEEEGEEEWEQWEDDDDDEALAESGADEEGGVTPAMIVAATHQTLRQNVYEVRIPLTPAQAHAFLQPFSADAAADAADSLSVVVGALVSSGSAYRTPLDIGCAARIAVSFASDEQ